MGRTIAKRRLAKNTKERKVGAQLRVRAEVDGKFGACLKIGTKVNRAQSCVSGQKNPRAAIAAVLRKEAGKLDSKRGAFALLRK